jgi:hypothetical protein
MIIYCVERLRRDDTTGVKEWRRWGTFESESEARRDFERAKRDWPGVRLVVLTGDEDAAQVWERPAARPEP